MPEPGDSHRGLRLMGAPKPDWANPLDLEGNALDWLLACRDRDLAWETVEGLSHDEARDLLWRVLDERAMGRLRFTGLD